MARPGSERPPLPIGTAVAAALISVTIALALANDNSPFPQWLTVALLVATLSVVVWVLVERAGARRR